MESEEEIAKIASIDLSKRYTRREVLEGLVTGIFGVAMLYAYKKVEPAASLLLADDISDHWAVRKTTEYSQEDLMKTRTVVIGDSNGVGYDPAGQSVSTAEIKAKKIDEKFNSEWSVDVEAHAGDNLSDTFEQLDRVSPSLSSCQSNQDIEASVGANDIKEVMMDEKIQAQVKELAKNPINPDIFPLAEKIEKKMKDLSDGISKLLDKIDTLKRRGAKIGRVFMRGYPNIGASQNLQLEAKNDKMNLIGSLDGTSRNIMSRMSRRANKALVQAIEKKKRNVDVLVDDVYQLSPEDLDGVHLNLKGKESVVNTQLDRSIVKFPKGPNSILKSM